LLFKVYLLVDFIRIVSLVLLLIGMLGRLVDELEGDTSDIDQTLHGLKGLPEIIC
jgi:hypothetical protein